MRVTPIFLNPINNNKQNSQNTVFGYGISISMKAVKNHGQGQDHNIIRLLNRVQDVIETGKEYLIAIIKRARTEIDVSEDNMHTIGIKISARGGVIPEIAVEVKGIEDQHPILISDFTLARDAQGAGSMFKVRQAVEAKARESALLAKNLTGSAVATA